MPAKPDLIETNKGSFTDDFLNDKQKDAVVYFKENLNRWINDPLYKYKYVIIREGAVVGVFDTFNTAITEAVPKYPENDFIIQQIISDKDLVSFIYSAIA